MNYIHCPAGYQKEGRSVCQFSDGGNCSGISCSTYRAYISDFLRTDVPRDFVPSTVSKVVDGQRLSRDGIPLRLLSR